MLFQAGMETNIKVPENENHDITKKFLIKAPSWLLTNHGIKPQKNEGPCTAYRKFSCRNENDYCYQNSLYSS